MHTWMLPVAHDPTEEHPDFHVPKGRFGLPAPTALPWRQVEAVGWAFIPAELQQR